MVIELFLRIILGVLFFTKPTFNFSKEEMEEYERIFEEAKTTGIINYNCSFPKSRFIEYLSLHKDIVIHGSNNLNISIFETRKQTLYNGKYTEAVFAIGWNLASFFCSVG